MAAISFSRLSVLVVDDSAFTRSLMRSALRGLGVGHVTTVRGGAEAIKRLARPPGTVEREGPLATDILLADFVMPTIDGLMLLRWVRQHRESPNRFLPCLMMSAVARPDAVASARDLGAEEFLAKPFSGASVAAHLLAVVERPRNYVYCAGYFGPDRRRLGVRTDGVDRRTTGADEIRVVYGDRAPPRLSPHGHAVWQFQLANRLKDKLLTGEPADGPAIDPALIEQAEQELGRRSSDYADWVRDAVARLDRSIERCLKNPDAAAYHYRSVARLAIEFAGQGGIFGYPLITEFGRSLHEYAETRGTVDTRHVELVKAHADAISAVIREKVRGDGGATGAALIESLRRAKSRYESSAA